MKTKLYKYKFFIIISLILISCKTRFLYEDIYTRNGKKSTYFQKKYNPVDSVNLRLIKICQNQKLTSRKKHQTKSEIIFNYNSIYNSLYESLEDQFDISTIKSNRDLNWDIGCKNLNPNNFPFIKKNGNDYNLDLTLDIEYLTSKNYEVESSSILSEEDLGNDIHAIDYQIIIALSKVDSLIYMDNVKYMTTVLSKRNEKLDYEIPIEIIRDLISKSLAEYKKRLE